VYATTPDPYCYAGTTVLKNRANLRDQAALDGFEHDAATQRAEEPYPTGQLSVTHYKALHRHLFQDVYPWAGRFRTVRIAKGGSMFCYPEHIDAEMKRLFAKLRQDRFLQGSTPEAFAQGAAHFLAELNAIHPFREGNGRTQLAYLTLLAERAGHPLALERLDPTAILEAAIASFGGNEAPLAGVIRQLLPGPTKSRRR
jgi:cell filamentation protein